jgi:hypothetical protein
LWVIGHPSSVIGHPSSVIRHPSSVIGHPSSVIRHPSSVIDNPRRLPKEKPFFFTRHPRYVKKTRFSLHVKVDMERNGHIFDR